MTEKAYGGSTGIPAPKNITPRPSKSPTTPVKAKNNRSSETTDTTMDTDKLIKAGAIAQEAKALARSIIKKDAPLLDIVEKVEAFIIEQGGKPAFPINCSINEIAAHATPAPNDTETARGLLKVDLGVHIDGFVADTAFSVDLENSEENAKMIETAEKVLKKGVEAISMDIQLGQLGKAIHDEATKNGYETIKNLSGHSIEPYDLHAGITLPNFDNNSDFYFDEGVYAIEPFVVPKSASCSVKNGRPSGIYHLENPNGSVRDPTARKLLAHIKEHYNTLPFCTRWLVKEFGPRAQLALRFLEQAHILHHYPQLIEASGAKVAQAEHTVILTEKEKIITT